MWVEYVGHHPEVEVDGVGLAEPGVPIEVPDQIGGRPPSGHRADGEDFDPGEGLLAQPGNWAPVTRAAARAAAKDAAAETESSSTEETP